MKLFWTIMLGFAISPALAHDWMQGEKTPDGIDCCSNIHCRPLERGAVIHLGEKIVVFPGGKPTTITIIHPSMDPEGRTWICTTGCAFQSGTS